MSDVILTPSGLMLKADWEKLERKRIQKENRIRQLRKLELKRHLKAKSKRIKHLFAFTRL